MRRLALLTLGFSRLALATQAPPVQIPGDQSTAPQIEIAGVGIATGTLGRTQPRDKIGAGLNFGDSAIQLGAAQRLYEGGGIGSFVFGGVTTEGSVHGSSAPLFIHQGLVDYQSESLELLIGRADQPTAHLVDFPTLRGDDLVTLTNPLNPYSNGHNAEEHRYANVAAVTINQGLRYYQNVHVQHLIDSAGGGTDGGINAFGASLEYLGTVGSEMFSRVPAWGIGYEHVMGVERGLHQLVAGGVLNLNESVTDRWDLRVQELVSLGSDRRSFTQLTDTFQGDSQMTTLALGYLCSPFGRPGYQLSLTAGYKSYFKVADATSIGGALTGVRRLGQGFDLVAQYQGQWRGRALAAAQSDGISYEHVGEIGLVFNFNAAFNEHLSPRRSILNQRHQYVPGPTNPGMPSAPRISPKKSYAVLSAEAGDELLEGRGFGDQEPTVRMMNLMMVEGTGVEGMTGNGPTAAKPSDATPTVHAHGGTAYDLVTEMTPTSPRVGTNRLQITVHLKDSSYPAPGLQLQARVSMTSMDMGSTIAKVREAAVGVYEAQVSFSMKGSWAVIIRLPDGTERVFSYEVRD